MTFTFNTSIPAAANDPSVDQPDMLTNNVSTDGLIGVDHISFNASNGGQHKQVTFNNKNVPAGQTDPQSVLYTDSGTASSVSQLLYKNQNTSLQISAIRAWGYASGNVASPTNAVINNQSYNVTSVVRTSTGAFTITLNNDVVTGTDYAILVSMAASASNNPLVVAYSIASSTTFTLVIRAPGSSAGVNPTSFSFQVLQI